ncbi:hypothetical protein DAMA08_043240 [Martiniozyma asiatica (nom. inval.)]|nr:hypothetical protein DAMA08_043240 [Martiniozyma asiatica]
MQDDDLKKLTKKMDMEDRTFIEIVRKLRGDDEEAIVDDYLMEICDIYRIDLFSEGKFSEAESESDGDLDGRNVNNNDNANEQSGEKSLKKVDAKKGLDDLDDLRKRFNALKKI